MRYGLWLVALLGLTISCIDKKDYSITAVTFHSSLALPVVHGNLTIQDLLKNEDSVYVKVYPDDLVYLEYSDVLTTRNIRDLFQIPDKSLVQAFALPQGTIPPHAGDIRSDSLVEVVDLGMSPEQLSHIDFKSGTISYSASLLPGTSQLPYDVILTSSDLTVKATGNPLSITTHSSGSLSLGDYNVALTKNKFNLKMVLVLKKTTSPVLIGAGTSVRIAFSMIGMDFHTILGFFGDQTVHPPPSDISLGAFGNSLNDANVSFAQPQITLQVINDYGVPCNVNFITIEARKEGASLPFQLNPASPITIAFPATPGNSATTSVAVTNARQILDFAPTDLFYQLSARINQGFTSGNNFLADTSAMRVKMNVEVPLFGHASGIVLTDTAKIDLSSLEESELRSASLKVDVTNELPLDARIQVYLTDANYTVIDSLLTTPQTYLVKGSTVTVSGDLEVAGILNDVLILDVNKLNMLFTAKKIIIRAVLNSSKDSLGNSPDVRFKSTYRMIINMGLLAELDFDVNHN